MATVGSEVFEEEYQNLNKAQKEAVDTIDGPVMVIAGPGTGKTQILALRIGQILQQTDVGADGILCLTFTNSAVRAMRERLHRYIGPTASRVQVSTFHKFCAEVIEEFYPVLGLGLAPRILEDAEGISICDQILRENDWQHIRPRGDAGRYFKELKSLISLLKREKLSASEFRQEIDDEITRIQNDAASVSTRGVSKGKLKQESVSQIESLERTREIALFYQLYEEKKKEEHLMDHDDTIGYALEIMEESEEARAEIRERYLYVLIDEHQDSSGAQNSLLRAIWQGAERPNIFAVGDDRQLIYAFGGAKMSYFEDFKAMFGQAKVIFLTHNYRSTQNILDTAGKLLQSAFSDKKLVATLKENSILKLVECDYPRDEIMACGLDIKEKLAEDRINLNECAVLVPKNRQAVSAVRVLQDMGIKVVAMQHLSLFDAPEFDTMLKVLKVCADSHDAVALAGTILDRAAGVPVLSAHEYLYRYRGKDITLESMLSLPDDLFGKNKEIKHWAEKLRDLVLYSASADVYDLVQAVGDEVLIKTATGHDELLRRIEVVRSLLHLSLSFSEKKSLLIFIAFIERLREYGEDVPLAVFRSDEGVKVMTLHSSKGLEFDFVWIAHLDEGSVMRGRRRNFKLPSSVAWKIEEKDELAAKRELYVAITRAKRFCALSYSRFSYGGQHQEPARILADLSNQEDLFVRLSFQDTENQILSSDPKNYVISRRDELVSGTPAKLIEMVAKQYTDVNVSVSLLNNFFECPRKWYFRNLLKLPEPKSETLEYGSAVHSAIDKILKLRHIPAEEEIKEIVGDDRSVFRVISQWVKNSLPGISDQRESEKSISVRVPDFPLLNIYGKIDLVEKLNKENLRVTDFKTGNPRKKSDIERMDGEGRMSDYMRQLAMYSFLLGQGRRKTNVKESRLEFLEAQGDKERFYDTTISPEQINLLIQDIKDYDHLVRTGGWINRPCNYNSYLPAPVRLAGGWQAGGRRVANSCQYCKLYGEIYKRV